MIYMKWEDLEVGDVLKINNEIVNILKENREHLSKYCDVDFHIKEIRHHSGFKTFIRFLEYDYCIMIDTRNGKNVHRDYNIPYFEIKKVKDE